MRLILFFAAISASLVAQNGRGSNYLADTTAPDIIRIIPPAPAQGSPEDTADRSIFRATRSLLGSPRWDLAKNDNNLSVAALLMDFRCALGLSLTPEDAPRTAALVSGIIRALSVIGPPKTKYNRKRPFLVDPVPEDQVCVVRPTDPDYPSGHSTLGWSLGLVLAEAAPDHASDILVRARAFGESRVVCGVHNASAVEAGRVTGAALAAALHGSAMFRADLDAAKAEIAELRKGSPVAAVSSDACSAEAKLISVTPY